MKQDRDQNAAPNATNPANAADTTNAMNAGNAAVNAGNAAGAEALSRFREKCLKEGGISYSAGVVFIILLSLLVAVLAQAVGGSEAANSDAFLYCAYLASQVALGGAIAVYFVRSREQVKAVFAPCKPHYFLLAILLQFGLLFSLSELNTLFIALFEKMGYVPSASPLPALGGIRLLPAVLVIALLPAVCEEVFFRGLLSRNMQENGWGIVPNVLISGALFSLYHGNPEQTVYQFLCGVCFALMAVRAGSILPTVLAHFLNNAVILTLTSLGFGDLTVLGGGYIALIAVSAVTLAAVLAVLIFVEKRGNRRGKLYGAKAFFASAGIGIAVCAVEWIVSLAGGFLHG